MERPTSRPPSPVSAQGTSTVAASEVSLDVDISRGPSQDEPCFIDERNVAENMQLPSSNTGDNDSRDYRPVATDDPTTFYVQPTKRKVDWTKVLADCVSVLLPIGFVVFVALVWSLKDSRVIGDSHDGWQNGTTVSNRRRGRHDRLPVSILEPPDSGTSGHLGSFPLGTQSLLRMSELRPGLELSTTTITYFDNSARSQMIEWTDYEPFLEFPLEPKARALETLYTTLVSTPETSKRDTMDPWGHVKIPFLESASENNWKDVPRELNADGYSSLVSLPLNPINQDSKTTFSLESSYMQLQCSNTTASVHSWPDGSTSEELNHGMLEDAYNNFYGLLEQKKTYQLPNGTWHGFPMQRSSSWRMGKNATWSLGLNRFVDAVWFGGNQTKYSKFYFANSQHPEYHHRPILFKSEARIETGHTELLFRAICTDYDLEVAPPLLFFAGKCGVTQRYVESRVTCTRSTDSLRVCSVTAQRPSRQLHASNAITPLSFPLIFRYISKHMPLIIGGGVSYQTELSLHYLANQSLSDMNGADNEFLKHVTDKGLGTRLSQLLNTYYQLSQLTFNVAGGAADSSIQEPSLSVDAESRKEVTIFAVSDGWAGLCLVTCVAMLAAGVLSVVFAHRARGPETLGYVSTVFRDSKHFELLPGSDRLPAVELSRSMARERIRYGLVRNKKGEEPLLGVAREEETGRIIGM
ncbi:hypothetical protein PG997_010765 [Apiospora hydei]|uniref:Transmembrane protein n=1 Tax=Apiospora hydei TaxID=1337664 RepID=A0ABR1VH73_9PEZI